ncbi:MAG TPA: FAD-dependent oxidoreductase [Ktedonobacteraceae bacterium]
MGNGIAGLTAAIEARRLAPALRIAIITEQSHPTINTPALKQFAIGKLQREQLLAYPIGTERAQQIQVIHGRVVEIHAQGKYVALANGGALGYGSLLLATGSVAAGLPAHLPGRDFDGVMTLHRLHDYMSLRRILPEVEDAVVVGAGAHAVETVTSLLYLGIRVHWLIRGKTCLSSVLDDRSSELVLQHIRQAGAKVYTETEIVGIAGNVGAVAGVVTNQQQMLPCQIVLVCTGMKPVTALAEHCTLPVMYERNRGIVVNNLLRTNVPGIYAAGDVAALQNPLTGVHERRAQWYAAVVQGCSAAAAMIGQSPKAIQSSGVPWHATRLGELSLLTVGSPLMRTPGSVTLTDNYKGTYQRLSILDNRLIGYLSLGQTQPDGLAIKRLIDEGLPIAPVKEALLRGTFDARKYFSQQHSRSALAMPSPGKQPVVITAKTAFPSVIQSRPESDSLSLLDQRKRQIDRPLSIVGSMTVAPHPVGVSASPALAPRSQFIAPVSAQFRAIQPSQEKDSISKCRDDPRGRPIHHQERP